MKIEYRATGGNKRGGLGFDVRGRSKCRAWARLRNASILIAFACLAAFLPAPNLAAQTGEPRISGRVVGIDGQPMEGVRVALLAHGSQEESNLTARTNSSGDFSLQPRKKVTSIYFSLVAYKQGYAVGYARSQTSEEYNESGAIPSARNVTITLQEPQLVTFQVVDTDGKAVPEASVYGRAISKGDETLFYSGRNGGLKALERKTDRQGRVTLDYLPPGTIASVTIETPQHGAQMASVSANQTADAPKLQLLPTGIVNVVFASTEPIDLGGRTVSIQTSLDNKPPVEDGQPTLRVTYSSTQLTTNNEGVAEGRVLAGKLSFYSEAKPDDTAFIDMSGSKTLTLGPGETLERRFEFRPGVRARGRVIDTDGNTVQGVVFRVQNRTIVSDEKGEYEVVVPATSQVYFRPDSVPTGYVMPYNQYGRRMVTELVDGKKVAEQPDVIVGIATNLRGRVLDVEGKPVAGAIVDAAWQAHDPSGSTFTRKTDQSTTDKEGQYVFQHVQKDCDVLLTANTATLASKSQTLHTEANHKVDLTVASDGMIDVIGTVKGSQGQAISNATIAISRAMLVADGNSYGTRKVKLNGQEFFTANPDGKFVTPAKLPKYGKYAIKISAPGYLSHQTKFLQASETGNLNVGETLLVQARNMVGSVVDSTGKPISGVTVSAYSAEKLGDHALKKATAKTDADGKFELLGLHPNAAVAIIEHDGFRISGLPLVIGAVPTATLYRIDETTAAKHRIGTTQLDTVSRREVAKKFLAKIAETRRNSNYFHGELAKMLFRTGRDAALAELDNTKSAVTRTELLVLLGETEEAAAEATGISDPYRRCFANIQIASECNDEDLGRDILSAVLVDAEQIKRPDHRIVCICKAADAFYEKGDKEFSKLIITSQVSQARELSTKEWPGYARASFAENLSLFDYAAAMKMVGDGEKDEQHRHLQNIAHRLAAVDPEKAEQTLKRMEMSNYIDSPVVRVAYRMAKVDLDRALGLLELINQNQRPVAKARTLGVIAMSIHKDNPPRARKILKQAFDAIPELGSQGGHRADDYFQTAMTLLRYAEQVAPDYLTDYFWITASHYGGPRGNAWSPEQIQEKNAERQAELAVLLAMYEQPVDLLTQVAEPLFAHWENKAKEELDSSRFSDSEIVFTAMALTNPERAAAWGVECESAVGEERRRTIPQPWEVIGNTLTLARHELGKQLTRKVYHRWVIDEYD